MPSTTGQADAGAPRWSETWVWVAVGAFLVVRLALSLYDLRLPGLEQDETLFVNAATLRVPHVDIAHQLDGVPAMLVPSYIGALKSWLYDPIFAVFGTSPIAIRLPVVVIATAGVGLIYPSVRALVNRRVALLALVIVCFDSSVFWLTRDDVGPTAIEFFLMCAGLFCAARFATSHKSRWVVILLVVFALGVFNKLDFIWVVNAGVAVSAILAGLHRRALRLHRRLIVTWCGGLALIYAGWGLYSITNHVRTGFLQSWHLFELGMRGTLAGTYFYNYAFAAWGPPSLAVLAVVLLFICGCVLSVMPGRTRSLPMAMLGVTTLVMTLQILVTKSGAAGWHYVSVYPFVSVVAAYGVYAVAVSVAKNGRGIRITLIGAAVVALAYDGVVMARYFNALHREPAFSAWTPAIYTLSRDLQGSDARVFTADWGIFNPLFALHPGRRYTELAFDLRYPSESEIVQVSRRVAATPGLKLIVTHAPRDLIFPAANEDLFRSMGTRLHLARTITGVDGKPVYEIYAYR